MNFENRRRTTHFYKNENLSNDNKNYEKSECVSIALAT